MTVKSYGILLYRKAASAPQHDDVEVFLIQPNGPHFWNNEEFADVWGFPKGRREAGEKPLEVAKREFTEEVGVAAPDLTYTPLKPLVTRSNKIITIYAGDANGLDIVWNQAKVHEKRYYDGPTLCTYSETRDGQWFTLSDALRKIGKGQRQVLEDFANKMTFAA